MIIEFTGCSGAGKTVLLREVQEQLRVRGEAVDVPVEVMCGKWFRSIQRWPRLENLALDMVTRSDLVQRRAILRDSVRSMFQDFCLKTIEQVSLGAGERRRLSRNTARKLLVDCALRRRKSQQRIVLVDEGIIHLAHVLLGRGSSERPLAECRQFSKLAPRPHLLVWVKAAPELAEKRIDARGAHRPLPDRSFEERKKFIRNADAILENAIGQTDSEDWVIKIENNRQDKEELRNHANRVAEAILRRRAA